MKDLYEQRRCVARMLLPARIDSEIERRNQRLLQVRRGWKSIHAQLRGPQIALELRGSAERRWTYLGNGVGLYRSELLVFKPAFQSMGVRS